MVDYAIPYGKLTAYDWKWTIEIVDICWFTELKAGDVLFAILVYQSVIGINFDSTKNYQGFE